MLDIKYEPVRKAGEMAEGLSLDVLVVFSIPVTCIVFLFFRGQSFKLLHFLFRQYL